MGERSIFMSSGISCTEPDAVFHSILNERFRYFDALLAVIVYSHLSIYACIYKVISSAFYKIYWKEKQGKGRNGWQ